MHPREGEDLDDPSDKARNTLDEADGEGAEAKAPEGYAGGVHEGDKHLNALVHKCKKRVVEDGPDDAGN